MGSLQPETAGGFHEYEEPDPSKRRHPDLHDDDPADDLRWHKVLRDDPSFEVQVLPAWRPDKAMNIEKPDYAAYIRKLEEAACRAIRTFGDLQEALKSRMAFFAQMGCRASDHALEYVMYAPESAEGVEKIFARRMAGEEITKEEERKFKTAFMRFVAGEYVKLGWVMQIHYGCRRDNNLQDVQKTGAGYRL